MRGAADVAPYGWVGTGVREHIATVVSEGWDTVAFPSGGRWILRSCAEQKTDEVCCKAVEEVYTKEFCKTVLGNPFCNRFAILCGTPHPPQAVPLPPLGKAMVAASFADSHHLFDGFTEGLSW